jgi:hypothetical protein
MGMIMALTGNVVTGGMLTPHHPAHFCKCDGQFSEHESCRFRDGLFEGITPHDKGMCPQLPYSNKNFTTEPFTLQLILSDTYGPPIDYNFLNCASNPKSILLMVQGGAHTQSEPHQTFDFYLKPLIHSSQYKGCVNAGKLKVIWTAYSATSHTMDAAWPHQNRDIIANKFNPTMQQLIAEHGVDIKIVDWWNLTADAQTSDGFHHLTDVNLMKALHLINVADLFARQ